MFGAAENDLWFGAERKTIFLKVYKWVEEAGI
jgi:hypothetical protein